MIKFHFFPSKFTFLVLLFLPALFSFGQSQKVYSGPWTVNPFDQKVFIKNEGQFDKTTNNGKGEILFSASTQGIHMYWNAKGLTYKVTERYLSEEAKAEIAKGEPEAEMGKAELRYHYLNMEWVGSDPDVQVSSEEKASNYFTYKNPKDKAGKSGIAASAYKKITYKNIYPGIDAEYVLPEKGGIKYSLIVHPGADPHLIKMRYSDADKIDLNPKGEIEINSKQCGTYLEHQPQTYYEGGTPVNSKFTFNGTSIGFNISNYDKTKTLVIDPWVSPVNFPGTGGSLPGYKTSAYALCYDLAGNVLVYGGGDPLYLAKYSGAGALLWTFSVPFDALDLVGDFDVNKISGTSYVCEGYGGGGAGIVKVSPAGLLQATFPGTTKNYEISRIRLDCQGKLYTTGGGVPSGLYQVATIDTNLATMTGAHTTSSPNGDHDENLMCLDPSGAFMYVNFNYPAPFSADYLNDNEMEKIPIPAFTPKPWIQPGPIYNFTEVNSMPYCGPAGPYLRINIFNGMVCGNGFLYTYDGSTLKQWNKGTGVMVKSVATGGVMYTTGGLDLDLCENVYAGTATSVKEYDANLNLINTYPLGQNTCYDLKVDKGRNLLYTCGKAYVQAIAITPPPPIQLTTSVTPAGCVCNGTASASVAGGCNASIFNYLWSPGGQTTATATGLCAGTYTVIAGALVSCNKLIGDTDIVVIPKIGSLNTDFTFAGTCGKMTFQDTSVIQGATWSWLFPGGNPPSAAVQTPPSVQYPSGTYTVTMVADAGGGCADTVIHTFTIPGPPVSAFTSTPPCLGGAVTLTDGSVSPQGDPITSWNWSMTGGTPATSANQNPSTIYATAGTHTVSLIVTTQGGCKDTIDQQVIVYNPPVAIFSGSGTGCAPLCVTNYQDLSTTTNGNISSWAWTFPGGSPSSSNVQNPPSVCYNTGGTYGASLIVTTSYGCKDTIAITPLITVYTWPKAEFCVAPDIAPATDPVFNFCDMWSNDVVQWSWNFGDNDSDNVSTDPVHSYSTMVTDNDYYFFNVCIRVQTQNGCWDTTCHVVELIPEYEFYIPNTFTPNGDFMNEFFYGKCRGVKEYNIYIFDRWGNEIWDCHYKGKNTDWDGQMQEGMSSFCKWDGKVAGGGQDMSGHENQLVQEDVYVWKVELTDVFDKKHKYIGQVNIVK